MKIVVFGANGATGQLLTKQALAEGHVVTAVTRHPEPFPLRSARLQVMPGDVFDRSSVEQAVSGQDAVLSTLGVPFTRKPITVYSQGIAHFMQAMKHHGVRRLACVSSSATGTEHDTGAGFIFDNVLQPIVISTIGRTTYALERLPSVGVNVVVNVASCLCHRRFRGDHVAFPGGVPSPLASWPLRRCMASPMVPQVGEGASALRCLPASRVACSRRPGVCAALALPG